MAVLAGFDLKEYASAPPWKRIFYDRAIARSLEMQARRKEAEIHNIGVAVGQTVAKMFG